MKLVTTKFKSGGLHEKHVVATWNLGNHLSIYFYIVLYGSGYCESEEKYRRLVQLSHERTYRYDRQFGNTGQSSNDHCGKDGIMGN